MRVAHEWNRVQSTSPNRPLASPEESQSSYVSPSGLFESAGVLVAAVKGLDSANPCFSTARPEQDCFINYIRERGRPDQSGCRRRRKVPGVPRALGRVDTDQLRGMQGRILLIRPSITPILQRRYRKRGGVSGLLLVRSCTVIVEHKY